MSDLVPALISGLSGPGAAFILLAVVLYFAGKLLNRIINMGEKHLTSIEEKFDKLNDILEKRGEKLEDKLEVVNDNVIRLDRHLISNSRETLQSHKN